MTAFDDLTDEYLAQRWEDSPALATDVGVDGHDGRLADLSADAFARRAAADADWIDRLQALDDGDLSDDERIDRDLLISHHRGNQIMEDWVGWKRSPDVYAGEGLSGVFRLFLRRLHDDGTLTDAAVARMEQIPDVLAQGRANLDAELAEPALVRRAIGQCDAACGYFRDIVPSEVEDPALRQRLADAGQRAGAAYADFAAHLDALAERATGTYAIGETRYSALLIEREALGFDAAELRERGAAAYADLDAEMRELARRIDPSCDGDWPSLLERLKADHADDVEGMRAQYEGYCRDARAFLVEHDLVSFPDGESCEVVPSPMFQRPMLAVASYIRPPAFRPTLVGRFNVPYPTDDATPEQIEDRLRDNSRVLSPSIAVHEAYPGHHWHFAMITDAARPLRKIVTTPYFVEGWGLYAEKMMDEQGFFTDPVARLGFLQARLFRAARIVVDTSLHLGDMGREEAERHMMTRAGMQESVARAEVLRYTAWPTQAAAYLTGCLVLEDMRAEYLADPANTLKGFHDAVAVSGGMPLGLARRAIGLPAA